LTRSLIQTKGKNDRLDRATVREKFHYQRDQISALPRAVKESPDGGAESHLALTANVTTVFLGMDADVAFSDLSSGGTVEIGTKCGFWGQWRFLFLTRHKENRRLTPDFFSKSYQTTVKWRATEKDNFAKRSLSDANAACRTATPRPRSRQIMTIRASSSAALQGVAKPTPLLAPVMRTAFPSTVTFALIGLFPSSMIDYILIATTPTVRMIEKQRVQLNGRL